MKIVSKKYIYYFSVLLLLLAMCAAYYYLNDRRDNEFNNLKNTISTNDWRSYDFKGENHAFSISAPADWEAVLNNEGADLEDPGVFFWLKPAGVGDYYAPISVRLNVTDQSISQIVSGMKDFDPIRYEQAGADESLALRHRNGDSFFYSYILKKDKVIYSIDLMDLGGKYMNEMMAAIVDTIQFTN